MAAQRPIKSNDRAHVHPSMRSALKAYLDMADVQHHGSPPPPPSQPAPQTTPDMLSGLLLEDAVLHNATKKIHNPIDKMFFLGILAGIWMGLAGLAGLSAAGGIPEDVRDRWVVLPKLLLGTFSAFAIHFIIMFGGELFTGNTMILTIGVYNRVVPIRLLAINWLVVYLGNWAGSLITSYFFGYLTELFTAETYRSYLFSIAKSKFEDYSWAVLFLRAIPANIMICMAVMAGLASRDSAGKIMALWFPIAMFVLCGFEHCVANMFFGSLALMYGAPSSIGRIWFNQSATIPGNLIGGAIVIGLSEHLMNHWHSPFFRGYGVGTLAAHDVESTRRARDFREVHPADLVARVRAIIHAEHHHSKNVNDEVKHSDDSNDRIEEGVARPDSSCTYNGGTPLSLVEGHEEALERRKAMRAQLGMKGFAAWFGHGSKSEKETDLSDNV